MLKGDMAGFHKWGYPQIINFHGIFHYQPFWVPPFMDTSNLGVLVSFGRASAHIPPGRTTAVGHRAVSQTSELHKNRRPCIFSNGHLSMFYGHHLMFNQVFRIFYTVLIIIKRSFLCIMGKILIDQLIQDTLIHYAQTNRENAAFVMSSHLPGAVQICSPCSSGLYTTGNDPRWKAQLHCHQ